MIARRQLPAWSPLTFGALAAGLLPRSTALSRIERRIAQEYGTSSLLLTKSGTVALALGFLAAAPQGERPRVGLPAWGCYDLMTAADTVDALVLLYDLDPGTLAPDAGSLQAVLDQRPHAVVVAHWFGVPVDLRALMREAESAGVFVIDDAAQAVGAMIGGRPAGCGGDFGVLSFGRGKGRTGGEGGCLLAMTPKAQAGLRRAAGELGRGGPGIRSYLALWAQWIFGRPRLYGIPASLPGLNLGETIYRPPPKLQAMSVRSASVLEKVWKLSDDEATCRRRNATRWQMLLDSKVVLVAPSRDSLPGWLRYPIIIGDGLRSHVQEAEAKRLGILRGYPRSLADLPVIRGRIVPSGQEFPGARHLSRYLFTLPTHSLVGESDLERVATLLS